MTVWPEAFTLVAPGVGTGRPAPDGWAPLAALPAVVLVGLTGAGKTTAVAAVRASSTPCTVLPERRALVDRVVLPASGLGPDADREARFAATRRFARGRPGGVAAILALTAVAPPGTLGPCLFDGIRGAAEVAAAASALPRALFVLFRIDDAGRIVRLARRDDPLDRACGVSGDASADVRAVVRARADLLEEGTRQALLDPAATQGIDPARLSRSIAIVAEERRGYDPAETAAALAAHARGRTWAVDAGSMPPSAVAERVMDALRAAPARAAAAR